MVSTAAFTTMAYLHDVQTAWCLLCSMFSVVVCKARYFKHRGIHALSLWSSCAVLATRQNLPDNQGRRLIRRCVILSCATLLRCARSCSRGRLTRGVQTIPRFQNYPTQGCHLRMRTVRERRFFIHTHCRAYLLSRLIKSETALFPFKAKDGLHCACLFTMTTKIK